MPSLSEYGTNKETPPYSILISTHPALACKLYDSDQSQVYTTDPPECYCPRTSAFH